MEDPNASKGFKKPKNEDPLDYLTSAKPREIDVSLDDPAVFSKLLSFAMAGHGNDIQLNVKYADKTISYLKKKQFTDYDQDINIPWGFSEGGKDLAYHEFGKALDQYDSKTVQLIARIVLRLMRSASRNKAEPKDIEITKGLLAEISTVAKEGEHSALGLVGQLLTATASEAGRASTGYLNNYVTLHKLKHTSSDELMKEMLKAIFYPDKPVPKYYTNEDNVTKEEKKARNKEIKETKAENEQNQSNYDKTRHATAFQGSQHSMRVLSKIETLKHYKEDDPKKGKRNAKLNQEIQADFDRYKKMTIRDNKYIENVKSNKGGDAKEKKWRKIAQHYTAAASHEVTNYYKKENIEEETKIEDKKMEIEADKRIKRKDISDDFDEIASKKTKNSDTTNDQKDEMDEDKSKDIFNDKVNVLSDDKDDLMSQNDQKDDIDDDVMLSVEEEQVKKREIEQKRLEVIISTNYSKTQYNFNNESSLKNKTYRSDFNKLDEAFKTYEKKFPTSKSLKNHQSIKSFISRVNNMINDSKDEKTFNKPQNYAAKKIQ